MVAVVAFAVVALVMFGAMVFASIRIGPRRGLWNQPAAAFRTPPRTMSITLILVGVAQLVALVGSAVAISSAGIGARIGLVVIGCAVLGVYFLMAVAGSLAPRLARRRADGVVEQVSPAP